MDFYYEWVVFDKMVVDFNLYVMSIWYVRKVGNIIGFIFIVLYFVFNDVLYGRFYFDNYVINFVVVDFFLGVFSCDCEFVFFFC